jgi:hypothetical protein
MTRTAHKSKESSSNFEENIRKILECPICWETIRTVPVYQCINGHVVCNECITKLESCCPICRINNSTFIRNRKLEEIIEKLPDIQLETQTEIQPCKSIRQQHSTEVLGQTQKDTSSILPTYSVNSFAEDSVQSEEARNTSSTNYSDHTEIAIQPPTQNHIHSTLAPHTTQGPGAQFQPDSGHNNQLLVNSPTNTIGPILFLVFLVIVIAVYFLVLLKER